MSCFETKHLANEPATTAPDGSDVRVLLRLAAGGMAHFQLAPGTVSVAITHRSVEEIWYVVEGKGQMWRKQQEREEVIDLEPGVCLSIPLGTHFQFRASPSTSLAAVGITMPPWPGEDEAMVVAGRWPAG